MIGNWYMSLRLHLDHVVRRYYGRVGRPNCFIPNISYSNTKRVGPGEDAFDIAFLRYVIARCEEMDHSQ